MEPELVSLAEAAHHLATTELKVLMLLRQKQVAGELQGGEWRISRRSLALFQERGKPEQPVVTCRQTCRGCGAH